MESEAITFTIAEDIPTPAGVEVDQVTTPEVVEVSEDDILRMGSGKTLKQLRDRGVFLLKQKVKEYGPEVEKDLFVIAVSILLNPRKKENLIDILSTRNAQLKDEQKLTFEALENIETYATRYIQYMQTATKEATALVSGSAVQRPGTLPDGATSGDDSTNGDPLGMNHVVGSAPDPVVQGKALAILKEGNTLQKFRDVFRTIHSGDETICDVILLAGAAQQAITTMGIQPSLSGEKGSGKTSGVHAALHLWPPEYVFDTSFSSKALFYDKRLQPGCLVFTDDTFIVDDIEATIKKAMSKFQKGTHYLTVQKVDGENSAVPLKIPERTVFIFTSVDNSGSDETSDRQYQISLSPDSKSNENYDRFLKDRMLTGREEFPITEEVQICWEILREIKSKLFFVTIPFANRVKFSDLSARRDMNMFWDFTQAVTILNFPDRASVGDEPIIHLEATEADFYTAESIFTASKEIREHRLTKEERALTDWLATNCKSDGITESEIISDYRTSSGKQYDRMKIRRLLHGRDEKSGGLLSKIPGLYMQKQLQTAGEAGTKVHHNVYFINENMKTNLDSFGSFVSLEKGAVEPCEPPLNHVEPTARFTPGNSPDSCLDDDMKIYNTKIVEESIDEPIEKKQANKLSYPSLLKKWNLPEWIEVKKYIHSCIGHERCRVPGCKCNRPELWYEPGKKLYPLCDEHYQELLAAKEEGL